MRKESNYTPVLGLLDDATPAPAPLLTPEVVAAPEGLRVSVIIPARNEEANLNACLQSLLAQDDALFRMGEDWELIVVDDGSTDGTRALAQSATAGRAGASVMPAPEFEAHGARREFTGKTNACWAGAQASRGRWLLFTDADTVHEPGSVSHALHEAEKYNVATLSYSPRQIVAGFWQRALMPLVFSELASVYKPADVSDPAKRIAAANGQFLLVERTAYFAVGGHKAVGRSVLEDVDLAVALKRAARSGGRGLRFRYAPDALSTRMYRGFGDMVEGWTKNLALLFPHALGLAAWRVLDIVLWLLPLALLLFPYLVFWQRAAILLLWARTLLRFYRRVARSNFGFVNCAISVFALPLFVFLLVTSWVRHRLLHQVSWKGREYRTN